MRLITALCWENMWTTEVEEGTTYEESAKETIMQSLEELYLVNEHAGDYSVSLTDEEKKSIEDAADQFVEANDEEVGCDFRRQGDGAEGSGTLYNPAESTD